MKNPIFVSNIHSAPIFKASFEIMAGAMTVSRTTYKPDLLQLKSVCPMVTVPSSFNLDFETIALNRARQIWIQNSHNQNVHLFWSGGIDSTLALVALILTRPLDGNIHVYCNLNSLIENIRFYYKILKEKNVILHSSSVLSSDDPVFMVTGELGDQIFGSDMLFKVSSYFGYESVFEPYQKYLPQLFNIKAGDFWGSFLYDRYAPIVKDCPFPIKTTFDFVWWWNFSQKWQFVKYRKYLLVKPQHQLIHFFDDENFQLWSLFNHHMKIQKYGIQSYKRAAKEMIYKYDNNESYLNFKKKYGSPFGNKRHFYALFEDGSKIYKWQECYELIERISNVELK